MLSPLFILHDNQTIYVLLGIFATFTDLYILSNIVSSVPFKPRVYSLLCNNCLFHGLDAVRVPHYSGAA